MRGGVNVPFAVKSATRTLSQLSSTHRRIAAAFVAACIASVATVGTALASTASWIIVSSPGPSSYYLTDVTCVGASDCWAVGSGSQLYGGQALIEHNTGSGWLIVSTPSLYAGGTLTGVTCVNASNCWAVGGYLNSGSGGPNTSLIEHYDGISWTQVTSPPLGTVNLLASVACVNSADCWAVGQFGDAPTHTFGPAIEHYTGGSWTVVANSYNGILSDVTCIRSECWAVGGPTLHNAGNGWVADGTSGLQSISCVSTTNCWGVAANSPPIIKHYDGTGWTVVATPHPTGAHLLDVSCVGTSDCWAVGNRTDRGGRATHTLIEHHLASGWVINKNPTDHAELAGIACVNGHDCWAVGAQFASPQPGTLVEHYS